MSDTRTFKLPLRSITMSERRIMVTKFGVNWDAVEVDLSEIPQPVDRENPTEDEKRAAAKAFTRIVGPIEKFALLYIAVKRQLPTATEKEIETHADAGTWALDISPESDEVVTGDPLAPPTPERI